MKLLKSFLKEAAVFAALLFILALFMHKGELPVRFETALGDPSKFAHALIYTALIYMIVFIFRVIIRVIFMKFNARRDSK